MVVIERSFIERSGNTKIYGIFIILDPKVSLWNLGGSS
jgi:hypothetical protein